MVMVVGDLIVDDMERGKMIRLDEKDVIIIMMMCGGGDGNIIECRRRSGEEGLMLVMNASPSQLT
eukprot:scaffold10729_cov91-Skeletonema_dohrnii-CCMP3373.AAC.12